jgi:hypothetical protein
MPIFDKPVTNEWTFPYRTSPYFYNARVAKELLNKYGYVGLRYVDKNGKIYKRESFHGSILAVNQTDGIQIWEGGTGKIKYLPPDLRAWEHARKGTYKDKKTGELIDGVDFISVWLVIKGNLLSPEILNEKLNRTNGGAYNIYGFGTSMYGRANKNTDGTYTTTRWLTLLFFPIWPLGTYRISDGKRKTTTTFGFGLSGSHQASPLFLDTRQVVLTYLIELPILALAILTAIHILG